MVSKGGKIMAPKVIKTVLIRKSGDRSENITAVTACSATNTIVLLL
jgi:hypothetical protein